MAVKANASENYCKLLSNILKMLFYFIWLYFNFI